MSIFHLTFPKFKKSFVNGDVTFSIGNIKSRVPSVGYFILHCYDYKSNELIVENKPVYISKRFAIAPTYQSYIKTFEITESILSKTYELEIEIVLFGITSENPVWFNELMFEVGEHTEYHKPNDAFEKTVVLFKNNNYATLYGVEGNDLQVIRPNQDSFTTSELTKSKYTILAPHIYNEPLTDTPSKLMLEFINQTEQYIQIKK